jgi:hypothetical protein
MCGEGIAAGPGGGLPGVSGGSDLVWARLAQECGSAGYVPLPAPTVGVVAGRVFAGGGIAGLVAWAHEVGWRQEWVDRLVQVARAVGIGDRL